MTHTMSTSDLLRGAAAPTSGPDASRHASPAGDALTDRSRRIWSGGQYDRIAAGFRDGAEAFVARCALRPDQLVLDAACGSGNVTIPATVRTARVASTGMA